MQLTKLTTGFASTLSLRLIAACLLCLGIMGTVGCAGSSVGNSLQQSLEADPQLEEQGTLFGDASESATEEPADQQAAAADEADTAGENDGSVNGSTLPPGDRSRSTADQSQGSSEGNSLDAGQTDSETPSDASLSGRDRSRVLADVPEDLKPYIEDLMALQLFSRANTGQNSASNAAVTFEPNQPITRGQYANWLLTANNLFYSDQPGKKIRSAGASVTPAFQDVPPSHPYFGAIQGLAEAGLIPSALTGNSTAVNFRPDAPLTRESLILWKVPLDIRTPLPTASVDTVKATWGFQDAAEIEPLALRAVLADHQTGDFANILRAFGYTTLLQPQKAVTQAEAAATLWRFGTQTEGISAEELLERPQVESGSGP